ncbi:MAG: hypothetical protein GX443_13225 [Deltaproteobacteria bacterium]|nr:hypothetical protein [Deltaproteobacteria bacterium]
MTDWKAISLQAAIILLLTSAGIRFLSPDISKEDVAAIKSLAAKQNDLENRMGKVEESLASISRNLDQTLKRVERNLSGPAPGPVPRTQAGIQPPGRPSALPESPPPRLPAVAGEPGKPPGLPMPPAPLSWMENLSEEKRGKVAEVFKRHADSLRQAKRAASEGTPPSPESLKQLAEASEEAIKQDLRGILTEEEYHQFEKSLPPKPALAQPSTTGPN